MADGQQEVPWQVKRLRDLRDEWHRNEKLERGEDEYCRILKAEADVIQMLRDRVDPFVSEARTRGFVYFRTLRDISRSHEAIRLQFADGKGAFYERSLGIEKLAAKVGLPRTWLRELEPAIHSYVRSLEGIAMLRSRMRVKRVGANLVSK